MGFDQYGNWVNDGQGGVVDRGRRNTGTGYYDGDTGLPRATTNAPGEVYYGGAPSQPQLMSPQEYANYRAGYDAPAWNAMPPWMQAQYYQNGGAPGQQQQAPYNGGASLAELTRYFEQNPPADGDPEYWARQSLEKIQKGADVQGTLDYMMSRPDYKTLGGSGGPSAFGGGGYAGNYTPIGPMSYGERATWSGYNAPGYTPQQAYQAGPGFTHGAIQTPQQFQGTPVQGPSQFAFPGVYQQPQAQPSMARPAMPQSFGQVFAPSQPSAAAVDPGPPPTPPAAAGPPPPPPDAPPDPYQGEGVYGAEIGGWLSRTHPLAQQYLAKFNQPDPAAVAQYQAELAAWQQRAAGVAPVEQISATPGVKVARGQGPLPGTSGQMMNGPVSLRGPDSLAGSVSGLPMIDGIPGQFGGWNETTQQWSGPPPPRGLSQEARLPTNPPAQGTNLQPGQLDAAGLTMPLYERGPAFEGRPDFAYAQTPGTYESGQPFAYSQPVPTTAPGQAFAYGQPVPSTSAGDRFAYAQGVPAVDPFTASGEITAPTPYASYTGQGPFAYGTPSPTFDRFSESAATPGYTPGTFVAPTADEMKNDPGYQAMVQEAMGRLESSASMRGMGRTGQMMYELQRQAEEMASQRYAEVYGRRFGEFQQSEQARQAAAAQNFSQALSGYQTDAQTQLAAQAQGYGQAANTSQMNTQQSLAAYQANLAARQASDQTRMAAEQQTFGNALGAYQTNTQTQLGQQQQGYQQAIGSAAFNEQQRLADEQMRLAAQQQGYGQAIGSASFNEQQRMADQAAALAAQQQGYGQAIGTAGFNEQQHLAAFEAQRAAQAQGFGQSLQTYDTNRNNAYQQWMDEQQLGQQAYGLNAQTQLGAQNQAFGQAFQQNQANWENQFAADTFNQQQALAAYGLNAQTQQGYQQQQYQQAYNTWLANQQQAASAWQMNAGQSLAEFQAQAQAQQAAAALNQQGSFGAYDRNYNAAWNDYQSQVQQAQNAAGLGYQYASLGQNANQFAQNFGLQQNAQNFGQGLQTYQTNYQSQVLDPWSQALQAAQLGMGATSTGIGAGQGYQNYLNDLTGTRATAYGAGQVGGANAWANAFGNMASSFNPYAFNYSGGNSQQTPAYQSQGPTQSAQPTQTGVGYNPTTPPYNG